MTGPRTIGRRLLPTLGVVAVLALAAGCGGTSGEPGTGGTDESAAATAIRAATLRPGEAVPAPTGKAVLTLTGLVSAPNKGATIVLDQTAVDRLGQVQVTVYEPWIKKEATFRGAWLADVLKVAGIPDTATSLHVTALDDYGVDLSVADVRAGGILLATKAGDGSAIPVADGGPTRIVFLAGLAAGANADQWIWSLKTIEVR